MTKNLLIGFAIIIGIVGVAEFTERERGAENGEASMTPPLLTAETTLEAPVETSEPTTVVGDMTPPPTGAPSTPPVTPSTAPAPTPVPQSAPSAPAIPSKAPYIATIYYDGSNFIPAHITIPEGATVLFENASDRLLWVAANPHPSHTRYSLKTPDDCIGSAFDQCKAMKKGETWSFTFTEVGEWKYHNHMRDVDQGIVNVLTKEKYLKFEEERTKNR